MTTRYCHECEHQNTYGRWAMTGEMCKIGHKPRHYLPRNGNPYDEKAGWKRKCEDYKPKQEDKK